MGTKVGVIFDVEEDGYGYQVEPSDVPMFVVVEVLMNFLEDLKTTLEAAPVMNPADVEVWQALGRVSFKA